MRGKIKRIEAEQNEPILDIILRLADKHNGKQIAIAADLGITSGTLSYWYAKLGLKKSVITTQIEGRRA